MQMFDYPRCCKASIFGEFGAGHLSEDGDRFKNYRHTKEEIIKFFENAVMGLRRNGIQTVIAMPTNHQPEAIEALLELGFIAQDPDMMADLRRVYPRMNDKGVAVKMTHQMVPSGGR